MKKMHLDTTLLCSVLPGFRDFRIKLFLPRLSVIVVVVVAVVTDVANAVMLG